MLSSTQFSYMGLLTGFLKDAMFIDNNVTVLKESWLTVVDSSL